jgi:transcriptional regulator with XRE-family HTH domain
MARKTKNFADVIRRKLAANPTLAAEIEEERLGADIASGLFALRNEAGISQAELARRIGTQQPAIARLEDSDYDGHSFSMVKRIAKEFGKRVSIQFLPASTAMASPKEFQKLDIDITWETKQKWKPTIAEPQYQEAGPAINLALVA